MNKMYTKTTMHIVMCGLKCDKSLSEQEIIERDIRGCSACKDPQDMNTISSYSNVKMIINKYLHFLFYSTTQA